MTAGGTAKTIADAVVLIVTWRKTYHTAQLARQANLSASLAVILLRDGQSLAIVFMAPSYSRPS